MPSHWAQRPDSLPATWRVCLVDLQGVPDLVAFLNCVIYAQGRCSHIVHDNSRLEFFQKLSCESTPGGLSDRLEREPLTVDELDQGRTMSAVAHQDTAENWPDQACLPLAGISHSFRMSGGIPQDSLVEESQYI